MLLILLVGAGSFRILHPHEVDSLPKALYYTWALIFGEPPDEFPSAPVLQLLFFLLPVLGLIIILEGIIEFSLMLRDRRQNERSWCSVMAAELSNHVIVVGLGKLGYRSYRLLRRLGEAIVVIEHNAGNQFLGDVRRDGCPLFIGDARRETLLEEANAAQAKSIIVATNNDLSNLEIALDARRINPDIRLVLRLFDQNMADKIREGFNIQIAMSQSAISAPAFVMAAVDSSIVSSFVVGGQLVVMQRWIVRCDGPLCGKSIARVTRDWRVGVVERRTDGGPPDLMPAPNTKLREGDELLVQGTFETLNELRGHTGSLQATSATPP
jgi:Trk K+ transport system NAD-binding subunit